MDHPLLTQMQSIGIWPDEEARRQTLGELAARIPDERALARELVQHDLLTPLQANKLVANQASSLRIGSYVLMERIGEGGMGQVYKAKHHRLHKIVALKIIRPEKMASKTAQERFYREIRAVARLQHPNIVWAFDADRDEKSYYFAMQYMPGPNLSRLVKTSGPLSIRQGCDFIRQAALGLQHIADHGMIHRDIKPSNLLLTRHPDESGEAPIVVKIADLGLMRVHDDMVESQSGAGGLTQLGTFIGTPDYISPEQARNSKTVDVRGDIYSLGCSLYFILTAKPPFEGEGAVEKVMKHQLEEPIPITNVRSDVPAGLMDVLKKMMAKKPEDRYQSPRELAEALAPFCDDSPPSTAPTNPIPVTATPVSAAPVSAAPVPSAPVAATPVVAQIATAASAETFEFGAETIVGSGTSEIYSRRRQTSSVQISSVKIALFAGIGILGFVFFLWLVFGG